MIYQYTKAKDNKQMWAIKYIICYRFRFVEDMQTPTNKIKVQQRITKKSEKRLKEQRMKIMKRKQKWLSIESQENINELYEFYWC